MEVYCSFFIAASLFSCKIIDRDVGVCDKVGTVASDWQCKILLGHLGGLLCILGIGLEQLT